MDFSKRIGRLHPDAIFEMEVRRDGKTITLPAVNFERSYNEESGSYILRYDFKVNAISKRSVCTVCVYSKSIFSNK